MILGSLCWNDAFKWLLITPTKACHVAVKKMGFHDWLKFQFMMSWLAKMSSPPQYFARLWCRPFCQNNMSSAVRSRLNKQSRVFVAIATSTYQGLHSGGIVGVTMMYTANAGQLKLKITLSSWNKKQRDQSVHLNWVKRQAQNCGPILLATRILKRLYLIKVFTDYLWLSVVWKWLLNLDFSLACCGTCRFKACVLKK